MAIVNLEATLHGDSETQARCGRILGLSVSMKLDKVNFGFGPPNPSEKREDASERRVEPEKR